MDPFGKPLVAGDLDLGDHQGVGPGKALDPDPHELHVFPDRLIAEKGIKLGVFEGDPVVFPTGLGVGIHQSGVGRIV